MQKQACLIKIKVHLSELDSNFENVFEVKTFNFLSR